MNPVFSQPLTPKPLRSFIWTSARRGGRYAALFVLLGTLMGGLYGLLTGYVVAPAIFVVTFCGVLVMVNIIGALVALGLNLVLAPFGAGRRGLVQYVVMSFSFVVVYLLFFAVLHVRGAQVF